MNNITTLKPKEGVELLAIVVDKDAYNIFNSDYRLFYTIWNYEDEKGEMKMVFLSDNKQQKFILLGIVEYNKVIEFDCDGLVEVDKIGFYKNYLSKYNVSGNEFKEIFSKESFISLLEANNINLQQLDKEDKKLVILIKQ